MAAGDRYYWSGLELGVALRPFINNLFKQYGDKVLSGPFAGMEIPQTGGWDEWCVFLKLFGDYERELHGVIDKAIERKPDIVINVGCAEGYYAVGFGRCLPSANIYAFDINNNFLTVCRYYAGKNNIGNNFHTRFNEKTFSAEDLSLPLRTGHRLYFLDCEGAEFELLDPDINKSLLHSDLIVELHDEEDNSKTIKLISKLEKTHEIGLIPHEKRQLVTIFVEWTFNKSFNFPYDGVGIGDIREDTGWLVAWAKERKC